MTADHLVWDDDFSGGFSTEGPDARYTFLPFGTEVGHDGVAATSRQGLRVVAAGTNLTTGEPAFTMSLGQSDPSGLPGTLDHVKWLVYANKQSSGGVLGFDTGPGHELSCEARMSGAAYGVADHPFGAAVPDPGTDPRLASACLALQDPESDVAFEFSLTNEAVYVYYERLPNARAQSGDYASFLHTVPVARRTPYDEHDLKITYNGSRGVVTWFLDGREVFRLDRIGYRLTSRDHLVVDHGGVEERVAPRQLACGMGLFNFLDGGLPGRPGSGLVRLTTTPKYYYDPVTGEPAPQRFLDDASLASNRLFGQGAGFRMSRFTVSSTPVGSA
ncbi:DUF6081 family protein [Streptomyces syringium]|uniref:DUF6081 family protein n=1 Tax=Streptomyces syringium TaxID=76729 RepID=UPI003AAFADC4